MIALVGNILTVVSILVIYEWCECMKNPKKNNNNNNLTHNIKSKNDKKQEIIKIILEIFSVLIMFFCYGLVFWFYNT